MDPRAELARPLQDTGEPPRLLPLRSFLEEPGTPDDDQPFHHVFSIAPRRRRLQAASGPSPESAPRAGPPRFPSRSAVVRPRNPRPSTAPEPAGSQSEHSLTRPAARRPLTRTSARRRCRCPSTWPTPSHSTAPTVSARSPPSGQAAGPSSRTTSAVSGARGRGPSDVVPRSGGPGRAGAPGRRRPPRGGRRPPPPTRCRGGARKRQRRRSSPSPAAATTPGRAGRRRRTSSRRPTPRPGGPGRGWWRRVPGQPRHRGGRAPAQGAGREEQGPGAGAPAGSVRPPAWQGGPGSASPAGSSR